jgi:hypothetical protein
MPTRSTHTHTQTHTVHTLRTHPPGSCTCRDLAEQTHKCFQAYGKHLAAPQLRSVLLVGGLDAAAQLRALKQGAAGCVRLCCCACACMCLCLCMCMCMHVADTVGGRASTTAASVLLPTPELAPCRRAICLLTACHLPFFPFFLSAAAAAAASSAQVLRLWWAPQGVCWTLWRVASCPWTGCVVCCQRGLVVCKAWLTAACLPSNTGSASHATPGGGVDTNTATHAPLSATNTPADSHAHATTHRFASLCWMRPTGWWRTAKTPSTRCSSACPRGEQA